MGLTTDTTWFAHAGLRQDGIIVILGQLATILIMLGNPFQSEDLGLWQILLDIDLGAKILTFVNI